MNRLVRVHFGIQRQSYGLGEKRDFQYSFYPPRFALNFPDKNFPIVRRTLVLRSNFPNQILWWKYIGSNNIGGQISRLSAYC